MIDSRSYRREYAREEASYGYSDSYGREHHGGYAYECSYDSRDRRREECDGYEDRSRGDYVQAYDAGYQSGYSDGYYSRDCDCYVREEPAYEPPPPPPPPTRYEPAQDPYYFPSEPEQGCYRGGSGECG